MKRNKIMEECRNNMGKLSLYERIKIKFLVWLTIEYNLLYCRKVSKGKYIESVKDLLTCNINYSTNDYLYGYTNKQVDDNKKYFYKCRRNGLSPYKALLFFNDYLENKLNNVC